MAARILRESGEYLRPSGGFVSWSWITAERKFYTPRVSWVWLVRELTGPAPRRSGRLPVLSASEIAEYTFCRQAWYLARHGARFDSRRAERLHRGIEAHQRIGMRTDHVAAVDSVRMGVLVAVAVVVGILVVLAVVAALTGRM